MFCIVPVRDYENGNHRLYSQESVVYVLDIEDCSLEEYTISQIRKFPSSVVIPNINTTGAYTRVTYVQLKELLGGIVKCTNGCLVYNGREVFWVDDSEEYKLLLLKGCGIRIAEIGVKLNYSMLRLHIRYAQIFGDVIHIRLCLTLKADSSILTYEVYFSVAVDMKSGKLIGVFDFYSNEITMEIIEGKIRTDKAVIAKIKLHNNFK